MDRLAALLKETGYDSKKSRFLIDGFSKGFDLGYRGETEVRNTANNLKFTVGNKLELWNKVMKEVKEKRYAGPFESIPFENYIQSPIGLVPKDGGKNTRLIFHLSYPRNVDPPKSVNANTPEYLSKVEYRNFEEAVKLCLLCVKKGGTCFVGKSDLSAAFRQLCMHPEFWKYLIMKAQHPVTGRTYFFVDKCLPFGASISCAIFQAFSDALAHIVKFKTKEDNINYLDDFFFADILKGACDRQIGVFLDICKQINFPVSIDKTFWGTTKLVFLGLMIDTVRKLILIPPEKVINALKLVRRMLNSKKNKTTLRELQSLCGYLNFLCKCIVPGRAFTRRLYTFGAGILKPHHHIDIKSEMKSDLRMWEFFLQHPSAYARSFYDFDEEICSNDLNWYTDASSTLGCGGYLDNQWFIGEWSQEFLDMSPSINYMELYAATLGVIFWSHKFSNQKIVIFCDNMSVVHMINSSSSKSRNCMVLIRFITLYSMLNNVKIRAKHVIGVRNTYADLISRLEYGKFRRLAKLNNTKFDNKPLEMPENIWPPNKIWLEEGDEA